MEDLYETPLYPFIKSEKIGLDSVRLNVIAIDVRTGEILAWRGWMKDEEVEAAKAPWPKS